MAYGEGAPGHDADRNRQYPDVAGSPQGNAEGAVDISSTLLQGVNPANGIDASKVKQAAVANPGFQSSPSNYQPGNHYPFMLDGEPGLLGQDTDDYNGSTRDADYPDGNVPNIEFSGESGTRNQGDQGDPIDFNAVAPYEYPDFGKWPVKVQSDPTAALGK